MRYANKTKISKNSEIHFPQLKIGDILAHLQRFYEIE